MQKAAELTVTKSLVNMIEKHRGNGEGSSKNPSDPTTDHIEISFNNQNIKHKEKTQKKLIKQNNNKNNYITYRNGYIKIGAHNVQGFGLEYKQRDFVNSCKNEELDIVGLSETKLNIKNSKICLNNINSYKSWWASTNDHSKGNGVGIMMKRELAKHAAKIIKIKGRLISIDLHFKGKIRFRIINCYIEANEQDKESRNETINKLKNLITEGKSLGSHILVMGDFNADPEEFEKIRNTNAKAKIHGKYRILIELEKLRLHDIIKETLQIGKNIEHTWKNNNVTRRLDHFWCSKNLLDQIVTSLTIDDVAINSDHKMIQLIMTSSKFIANRNNAIDKRLNNDRKIYEYKKMDVDKWNEFKEKTDNLLKGRRINSQFIRNNTLDRSWDSIEKSIIEATNEIIPFKWYRCYEGLSTKNK